MVYVAAVVLGLIAGSALTALLARQAGGESWWKGRSHCHRCRHPLGARDLVPVLSFLVLRGSCRYCRGAIGWSYPAIEIALVAAFVVVTWVRVGAVGGVAHMDASHWLVLGRDLSATVILAQIFLYDLWYGYILDHITLPSLVLFFAWNVAVGIRPSSLLIGLVVGAGFFLVQYLVSRGQWVGGGDIRLGALMGVLLGWPVVSLGLFFAYVSGGAIGAVLLLTRRKQWGSHIPFGTFLSIATWAMLLFGYQLIHWYMTSLV